LFSDRSDEETWMLLPDHSILSYNEFGTNPQGSQRYVPSLDQWFDAGMVPVQLHTNGSYELGAANLLPDGRAFYIGATDHTALFTLPATQTGAGTWVAGPDIPFGWGGFDAPSCMMPNGRILMSVGTQDFNGPAHLFEYDPVDNILNPVAASGPNLADPPFI